MRKGQPIHSKTESSILIGSHPLLQFKRGDHVCVFYRDEAALLNSLADYIRTGLRNGERCFCAQKPHMIPKLHKALGSLGINAEAEVSSGALEIHTEDDVYFPEGRFEPDSMMQMLERSIEDAVAEGYSGFRTAGEMGWANDRYRADGQNYCDQLPGYERLVQASFARNPAIGWCQYPVQRFTAEVLEGVLDAHRLALEETMVSPNHSTLTLRAGDYLADIVADRINPKTAFHYVVQKRGTPDVLGWGVEPTLARALVTSEDALRDLNARAI